jgi:hypothetical protein
MMRAVLSMATRESRTQRTRVMAQITRGRNHRSRRVTCTAGARIAGVSELYVDVDVGLVDQHLALGEGGYTPAAAPSCTGKARRRSWSPPEHDVGGWGLGRRRWNARPIGLLLRRGAAMTHATNASFSKGGSP